MDYPNGHPSSYIEDITSAARWYVEAEGLLKNGRLLFDHSFEKLKSIASEDASGDRKHGLAWRAASLQKNALLLTGLALENALKGTLIDEKPEEMRVTLTVDGSGDYKNVQLDKIGQSNVDHDLRTLASAAGMFDSDRNPLLPDRYNDSELKDILNHLTHSIRWRGRYPQPLDFEERRELEDEVIPEAGGFDFIQNTHSAATEMATHLIPDPFLEETE